MYQGQLRMRFIQMAEATFPLFEPILSNVAGVDVALGHIGEPELVAAGLWRDHPNCKAVWDWRELMRKLRRTPKRLDVSFYCGETLCGLMVATISKSRVNVNVLYVEAAPDPAHPLKAKFLSVAIYVAELFAAWLNATHVSVSNPLVPVVDYYLDLGYRRTARDRKRMDKGRSPRDKLLIKDLRDQGPF